MASSSTIPGEVDLIDQKRRDRSVLEGELQAAGVEIHGGESVVRCPFHDDRRRSMSLHENESGIWRARCFACGESWDYLDVRARSVGRPLEEVLREERKGTGNGISRPVTPRTQPQATNGANANGAARKPPRRYPDLEAVKASFGERLAAAYAYTDPESGLVDLLVIRTRDKAFFQFHQDQEKGDFVSGAPQSGKRPLYNRSRLSAADLVLLVEGEKDVHTAQGLGIVATTSPGGASAAGFVDWSLCAGKTVIIWPDNDDPGKAYADKAVELLAQLDPPAQVFRIDPGMLGLGPKEDLSDYVESMGAASSEEKRRNVLQVFDLVGAPVEDVTEAKGEQEEAPKQQPAPDVQSTQPDPLPAQMQALAGFALTDDGNARAFELMHNGEVKWNATAGHWAVWSGAHWSTRPENVGEVQRRAIATMKARGSVAFDDRAPLSKEARERHATFAIRSENQARLKACIEAAQRRPDLETRGDQWDQNPMLLACPNATVDLRTGKARQPDPGDRITHCTVARWNAQAKCERWERFVLEITGGDETLAAFLRRAIGYSICGSTKEQVFFILFGPGGNGKSTFMKVLVAILGSDLGKSAKFASFAPREGGAGAASGDIARLIGARLVVTAEANENARLDEGLVKLIVGGDSIVARPLYRPEIEFTPTFKLWLLSNHKPVIQGGDQGIWRRIRLVPLMQRFETSQEPDLVEKLMAEAEGILRWCVQGCLEWQKEGLGWPEAVKAATETYKSEADSLGQFLEENCTESPHAYVTKGALFEAYRRWAERAGERILTKRMFGIKLVERGVRENRDMAGRYWLGISLREEDLGPSDSRRGEVQEPYP